MEDGNSLIRSRVLCYTVLAAASSTPIGSTPRPPQSHNAGSNDMTTEEGLGVFKPGIGVVVQTFEFRRRRDATDIAVYDSEVSSAKPIGFAPASIKTTAEAELWVNALLLGLEQGLKKGRKHLQDELRELLNLK